MHPLTHALLSHIPHAQSLDRGEAGDNLGALVRGTKREEVHRGMVMCAPGTMKTHTKFEAEMYVLTKDEGTSCFPPLFFVSLWMSVVFFVPSYSSASDIAALSPCKTDTPS